MKRYPQERKQAVLEKMMPPNNVTVSVLAQETGISDVTLYHWRKQTRAGGKVVPGDGRNPENWSPEDKFGVVLGTATLNEVELAEYCRKKGLYAEQIAAWKQGCIDGIDDIIISLYARGLQAELVELYGAEVSPTLISNVTNSVLDEVQA